MCFYFSNRQRLINARACANSGILLVELNNGEAILRPVTELQPTGTLRMPIPYRNGCAYTFANGKFFSSQKMVARPFGQRGSHRDVDPSKTWHLGAHK